MAGENKEIEPKGRFQQALERLRPFVKEKVVGAGQAVAAAAKAADMWLVEKGIHPLAATTGEKTTELGKASANLRGRAEAIGIDIDQAIRDKNQAGAREALGKLAELAKDNPRLERYYLMREAEVAGRELPGQPTTIPSEKTERKKQKSFEKPALIGEPSKESPLPPEPKRVLPWRPKKGPGSRPAVCLSDLERYQKIEMPKRMRGEETEEGETIKVYDPEAMNANQAIRVALELIHEGVLLQHPFSNIRREWIERYVSRVASISSKKYGDPRYKSLHHLSQAAFNFQDILYRVWRGQEGAQGAKAAGAEQMIKGVTDMQDSDLHYLLEDPEIEIAMHKIKGSVDQAAFVDGKERAKGDVKGGIHGSVEKLGHYLRMFSLLGGLDGTSDVFAESYTAQVLLYPREYFDREHYLAAQRPHPDFIMDWTALGGRNVESNDGLKMLILDTVDSQPNPSAFHSKSMAGFILDNFDPDKLGWQNIGRMLVNLEGAKDRDPRLTHYLLEDYLLASEEDQIMMAYEAYRPYRNMLEKQREINRKVKGVKLTREEEQLKKDLQLIITVNLYRTYYYNERKSIGQDFQDASRALWGSRWGDHRTLLNFDEAFDMYELDKDGKPILEKGKPKTQHHNFVDIGSLDATHWNQNQSGNFLNVHWTDWSYAYNTQNHALNVLCQGGPLARQEYIKAFQYLISADGYRHLSEPRESERSLGLSFDRQRNALHYSERLTRMYEQGLWSHRRHGRERLPWSEDMNNLLRNFYDMKRYTTEFENVGIYGVSWVGLRENQAALGFEERVAKILGKLERPDVWVVWANEIGLTGQLRRIFSNNPNNPLLENWTPPGWVLPPEWKEAGVRNYWEYMAYNAIVSFAGFKVRGLPSIDHDYYGHAVPRVRFDLDFEIGSREGRKEGKYWKSLLDVIPGMTDAEKDRRWGEKEGVRRYLLGNERERLAKYGKLNEPTFSPLLEMYEKGHEELFIDTLLEKYLQATFDDKSLDNWVENKWGRHLQHKKRWDTWSLLRRQMKYSIGDLADEIIEVSPAGEILEKGLFVHDQIDIIYQFGPDGRVLRDASGNPIFQIVVDDKGIPTISEFNRGFDHVASMSLGSVGAWRPPEALMIPPKHEGDINSTDPRKREQAEIEANYRKLEGMGDAGEEKQLSWLPLIYYKYQMLNFFAGRYLDPAYRYEQMINGGEEWEHDQCYLDVADEEQREEFFDFFEKVATEDHNWVIEQKQRLGVTDATGISRTEEFRDDKGHLMVRDIQGNITGRATEEELVNLQKRAFAVFGTGGAGIGAIVQSLPLIRSREEALSFITTAGLSGAGTAFIAANTLGLGTGVGLLVSIPVSILVGNLFLDKGVNKETAKENARGPADWLGGLRIRLFGGSLALGMVGKRVLAREVRNLAAGWSPVWDSAIPMQDIMKIVKEYKDKLKPTELE